MEKRSGSKWTLGGPIEHRSEETPFTNLPSSSRVEVGNVVSAIVVPTMYEHSMEGVVSRGRLTLTEKLIQVKLLWKFTSAERIKKTFDHSFQSRYTHGNTQSCPHNLHYTESGAELTTEEVHLKYIA